MPDTMTKAPCGTAFIFYKSLLYALAELILTTLGGETTFLATKQIQKLRLRMMVICPCSSLELAKMIHWGGGGFTGTCSTEQSHELP